MIKWAWENVGAPGIYFGPEIPTEDESESSSTGEEPGPSHGSRGKGKEKASGLPSLHQHLVGRPPVLTVSSNNNQHLMGREKGGRPVPPASNHQPKGCVPLRRKRGTRRAMGVLRGLKVWLQYLIHACCVT